MSSGSPTYASGEHPVHLRLVQPWAGDLAAARQRLEDGAADWLGNPLDGPAESPVRRFESDLALPMREQARHMVLRKAAVVELGPPREAPKGFALEVTWRSANLAPVFPVFVGTLFVSENELALDGYYAPPGGELGVILDRALLNIAARGTARWFLSRVAAAIDTRPAGAGSPPSQPD
jgi:hypothetical protein